MKGKAVTAYAVAISWTDLANGRTDLIPLLYSLSGEKSVDQQVARYLRGMLQKIVAASFTISAEPVEVETDGTQAGSAGKAGPSRSPASWVALLLRDEIQVCGTFV